MIFVVLIGGALIAAGAMIALPSTRSKVIDKLPVSNILTKKWWLPYLSIAIGISCISGGISNFSASRSGFPDAATYEAAKQQGISTYEAYTAFLSEKADKEALAKRAEVRAATESERYAIDSSGEELVLQIKPTSYKYFTDDSQVGSECSRLLQAAGPLIEGGHAKQTSLKDVQLSFNELEIDDAALLFTIWKIAQAYYSDKAGFLSDYPDSTDADIWQSAKLSSDCTKITQQKHAEGEAQRKAQLEQDEKGKREAEAQASFKREMRNTCSEWADAMKSCATAGNINSCMDIRYQGGGSANICNIDGSPL